MVKRTMTAAEFQAECMQVLDTVAHAKIEVIVTRRGKAVARIVPAVEPAATGYGSLRRITTIVDSDDDLFSVGEAEATRS